MNPEAKIVSSDTRPARRVLGVAVDVYLTGDDTNGQYTAYRCTVPPQAGPPPHHHDTFDEAFYVVSGTVEIQIGSETQIAGPGTYVFIPRGTPHTFRNVGANDAQFLGTATPAGHEAFFEEAEFLADAGPLTIPDAIALCRRHGIEIAPPPVAAG